MATEHELAGHELTVSDAFDVLRIDPRFYGQQPRPEISARGFYQVRPARLRMVGPTPSNRMLTFILDIPDIHGASHIVTGWESSPTEIEKYAEDV